MVKKGQGSSEYLVILAVVLIVALIAIALVGGLPSIGAESKITQSQNYWRSAVRPFIVPEHSQINSTFYITLSNVEIDRYQITNISLSQVQGGTSSLVGNLTGTPVATMAGNAKKTFSFNVATPCNETTNDEYEYWLSVQYTSTNIASPRAEIGTRPLIGRCVAQ